MMTILRDLIVPFGIVVVIGTMIVPMPPQVMDFLLAINLILACILLFTSLYIDEPVKLSALPTLLLLTTLFRLALNISSTRLILGRGDAGKVIEAFGHVVVQGNLIVGAVVFLIITIVQFIVIAKGSERVAEVSARFTLDALPGKQMSIDADLRAGLLDAEGAKTKREELQIESKFYGALDGAMKFVKGDSIAGLIVTSINVIGGLSVGIAMQGLPLVQALEKYTLLTVGDGLISQLPALLNSIAAGIVVTRVSRSNGKSVAYDLLDQLSQMKKVSVIVGVIALLVAVIPGIPKIPFLLLSMFFFVLGIRPDKEPVKVESAHDLFQPLMLEVLKIELPVETQQSLYEIKDLSVRIEKFRSFVFEKTGLIIERPCFSFTEANESKIQVFLRGLVIKSYRTDALGLELLAEIEKEILEVINNNTVEFIDDMQTRKLLDSFEVQAPEVVAQVVPGVVTLTQLTEVLKGLAKEGISLRYFDQVIQAVAEHGGKARDERALLGDVRIHLSRVISDLYASETSADKTSAETTGTIQALSLDPMYDMAFVNAERNQQALDPGIVSYIASEIKEKLVDSVVLLVTRDARLLLKECLALQKLNVPILAIEEISDLYTVDIVEQIECEQQHKEELIDVLAA